VKRARRLRTSAPGHVCYQPSSALCRASEASAASAEMNSHDPSWPCRKVHMLPVGRCTCAQPPFPAASSSIDVLCIRDGSEGWGVAASVPESASVSTKDHLTPLGCERASAPNWDCLDRTRLPPPGARVGGGTFADLLPTQNGSSGARVVDIRGPRRPLASAPPGQPRSGVPLHSYLKAYPIPEDRFEAAVGIFRRCASR
jgi:hypothetical protein